MLRCAVWEQALTVLVLLRDLPSIVAWWFHRKRRITSSDGKSGAGGKSGSHVEK